MAGLESIALAVAHLERVQEQQEENPAAAAAPPSILKRGYAVVAPTTLVSSPPPPSISYGGSPRMVSAEYSNNNVSYVAMDQQTRSGSKEKAPKSKTTQKQASAAVTKLDGATKRSREAAAMPAAVDALLHRISNAHEDLDEFFRLMEELREIGLGGEPQPIPQPDEVIFQIQKTDVLLGRGGETNHHTGNIQYRQLVKACQAAYLVAKRRVKPRIALAIVRVVRSRNGRFLKKHETIWKDVGNIRAREKTSQALREGAPTLRGTSKQQQASRMLTQPVSAMGSLGAYHHHHHLAAEQQHVMAIGAPIFHSSNGFSPPFPHQVVAVTADSSPKMSPKKKRRLVTSTTVVATVSAEEHSEGEASSSFICKSKSPVKKQSSGPRIKQLLKKRMIEDSSSINTSM